MILVPINKNHLLSDFDCNEDGINSFLCDDALKDHEAFLSTTFVLTEETEKNNVIAYYTIISHSLRNTEKELFLPGCAPRVPAILIGQIGVDIKHQKKGIGSSLIKRIFEDSLKINNLIHFPVIIVDAKTEELIPYYEKLGFNRFKKNSLRLFLPIKEILASL